jgi:hypothetical protein
MRAEDKDWPYPDYKKTKFCWWCSRKLWANKGVVKVIEGLPRTLHKQCVKEAAKESEMGERRFDFWESDDTGRMKPVARNVTESELRKRLYMIAGETGYLKREITDRHINILLHGEAKEPEKRCPYCKVVHKDTDTCMGYPDEPPTDAEADRRAKILNHAVEDEAG